MTTRERRSYYDDGRDGYYDGGRDRYDDRDRYYDGGDTVVRVRPVIFMFVFRGLLQLDIN